MVTPTLVVLTGASGAGKTTVAHALEALRRPDLACHYFDSIGVPAPDAFNDPRWGPGGWQAWALDQWLDRLAAGAAPVQVLDAQVAPAAAQRAAATRAFAAAHVLLVDCELEVRHARLKLERGQPELTSRRMDMWAAYMRGQADALGLPVLDSTEATPDALAQRVLAAVGLPTLPPDDPGAERAAT